MCYIYVHMDHTTIKWCRGPDHTTRVTFAMQSRPFKHINEGRSSYILRALTAVYEMSALSEVKPPVPPPKFSTSRPTCEALFAIYVKWPGNHRRRNRTEGHRGHVPPPQVSFPDRIFRTRRKNGFGQLPIPFSFKCARRNVGALLILP